MDLHIDRENQATLRHQLVEGLQEKIKTGQLVPGERLPSVRVLAAKLGLSPMTIVKAFDQLEGEGWIQRIQGKGTFVKKKDSVDQGRAKTDWQMAILSQTPNLAENRVNPTVEFEGALNLSTAVVDPQLLPVDELVNLTGKLLRKNPDLLGCYTPIRGHGKVLAAMAEYLGTDEQELLMTSGAQQAIQLTARALLRPNDLVVVEAPTYIGAIEVFQSQGARLVQIPLDAEGMRTDVLEAICKDRPPRLIYTIPAFHNPTGIVMSLKRRKELIAIAERYGVVILEDDIWRNLYHHEPPPPALYQLSDHGHVIYVKSFSKTLAPGFRVATMAIKGHFMRRLAALKGMADLGSPSLPQAVVAAFIQTPAYKRTLKTLRQNLLERCQICEEILRQHAPAGVRWLEVNGGINLWLTLPENMRAAEIVRQASKEGVQVLCGDLCFAGERLGNHLRLTFAHQNLNQLTAGVRQLCKTMSESTSIRPIQRSNPIL